MTPSCLLQCPRLLYVLCDLHLSLTYFLQPCTIFSLCCRCCRCSRGMLRLPHATPASGAHLFYSCSAHSLTHSLIAVSRSPRRNPTVYLQCLLPSLRLLLCSCAVPGYVRRQALLLLLDPCYAHTLHFCFWPLPVVARGPASSPLMLLRRRCVYSSLLASCRASSLSIAHTYISFYATLATFCNRYHLRLLIFLLLPVYRQSTLHFLPL